MEKIVLILIFSTLFLQADLQKACLLCHQKNQIPSELIYKRYLLKYSTLEYIEEAMYNYLKHPNKKDSIMPSAFFRKFPIKNASKDKNLKENIREYIDTFDIKKKLVLDK